MSKLDKLTILGIDPGNTAGYALLAFNGKLIKWGSLRNPSLIKIVNEVNSSGKVIIVGTDVNPEPAFAKNLSTLLGAKLLIPGHKLLVKEKRKLVDNFLKKNKEFIKLKNKHEKDALAAALYCYKRLRSLFIRVNNHLKNIGKEYLTNKTIEAVILYRMPIKNAVRLAEL
ncbi:MAG: DUF460 domain-containing protein [Nanoarchaeota archaeon]